MVLGFKGIDTAHLMYSVYPDVSPFEKKLVCQKHKKTSIRVNF